MSESQWIKLQVVNVDFNIEIIHYILLFSIAELIQEKSQTVQQKKEKPKRWSLLTKRIIDLKPFKKKLRQLDANQSYFC